MAVLGRLLVSSAERLDLPDLLSVDSYSAGDWQYFLKGMVGSDKPYVIKGFDVIDPASAIGTQSCSIRVADSMVLYPGSSAGPFFHGLAEGHAQATPLVPELRKNATNYIYLTLSTFNTSTDTRAFWDPDKDGGVGGEFTQDINTESVLKVDINVSTGSFPVNTIPIAKVTVGSVVITAIEDARDLMYRLGSGGISPNPFNSYSWRSLPSGSYTRSEPPTQMLAAGINPFQGADKNIQSMKEWMDAVMSKLRELGGSTYWYDDVTTFNLVNSFTDILATTFKSKGRWLHDSSTAGIISWSEDINIKITADPRTYMVRNGTATLADEQVAYLPLTRKAAINTFNEAVTFVNGQAYINTVGGAVGLFANLAKGDWIKKVEDPNHLYLRVEEFYDTISLAGSTTTAALARSIRLSAAYAGSSQVEKAVYDKGVYASGDVIVSNRNVAAITNTAGNFHWMALRSDTIETVGSVASTSLSLTITEHDGNTAKVTAGGAHNLVDGDRVTISASTNFNGTYVVEVETSTVFYITKVAAILADDSGTGRYAVVTTAARSTAYGLQLESANHGFETDQTATIAGTVNFNGSYLIKKRSATQFQIPMGSAPATETVGTATVARVLVRVEQGTPALVQGETVDFGNIPTNLKNWLGMQSDVEANPQYAVSPTYNTLDGMQNYNALSADNAAVRMSKLTAMMADKAQDKTIKHLYGTGLVSVTNTTNAAAQEVAFNAPGSILYIVTPGSVGTASVTLPNASPVSLLVNQVAYVTIDRNTASTPALVVANISAVPVDENIYVLVTRLSTTDIYLWDGRPMPVGTTVLEKADRNLGNLTATAINQDLVPDAFTTATNRKVGSSAIPWSLGRFMKISTEGTIYTLTGTFSTSTNQITSITGTMPAYQVAQAYIAYSASKYTSNYSVITNFNSGTVITVEDNSLVNLGSQTFYIVPILNVQTDAGTTLPSSPVRVKSGDTTSGPSGDTVVYTGASSAGNSGSLRLGVGTASGTRGSVYLESPTIYNVGNYAPFADNTYSAGTNALRFTNVWGTNISGSTAISLRDASNSNSALSLAFATAPSGVTNVFHLRGPLAGVTFSNISGATPTAFGVIGQNDATVDATKTIDLLIESGNKTAGTGDSGSIKIKTGTSAGGARGNILLDGLNVDVNSKNVINMLAPTTALMGSNKAYTDAMGGAVSVPSAAGTTTLTSSSPRNTVITGSTTQTVVLPSTAGLTVGERFIVHNTNAPTGNVTVNSSTPTLLATLIPNAVAWFTVMSTGAQTWDVAYSELGNASLEIPLVLGENLAINVPVYISEGAGDSRNAGEAYSLDNTNDNRINFVGFTKTSGVNGQTIIIKTSGIVTGLSSLTPGLPVYWVSGALTQTVPSANNTWQIMVGTAITATTLLINPDQAASAIYITEYSGSFTVANNQVADANITNLIFDGVVYRAFTFEYTINRTTASAESVESGMARGVYSSVAATWQIVTGGVAGSGGVTFSINASGQVTYTSTNMAGASYAGLMRYSIKSQIKV